MPVDEEGRRLTAYWVRGFEPRSKDGGAGLASRLSESLCSKAVIQSLELGCRDIL